MKSIAPLCFLIALIFAAPARADTAMKIFTAKGYVGFVVADDWAVLSMQTKSPVPSAVFQLPNSADADTAESTNLVLMLYDLTTEQGRKGFENPVKQYSAEKPQKKKRHGWSIYRQRAMQGSVEYTILDAKRKDVADVAASVRLAWPHLPNNPRGYDEAMEKTFQTFLGSVEGHIGPYIPGDGEVMRRPQ